MELFDAHVHARNNDIAYKLYLKFQTKSMTEYKRESAAREAKATAAFESTYPQVGDRVYFRSESVVNDSVFTGYGEVIKVTVRDIRRFDVLYKIKADHGMNYECYVNHEDPTKQGEFVQHAKE
jgi:hypothetical protein